MKEARAALEARERRFRSLIENSQCSTILMDSSCRVGYATPSISKMLGFAPEELHGKDLRELISGEHLDAFESAVETASASRREAVALEVRIRHYDLRYRWIEAIVTDLSDDLDVGAIVISFRDVTDRRAAEAGAAPGE